MFCRKCGSHLKDDAIKCSACGQPVPGYEGVSSDYGNAKNTETDNPANDKYGTDSAEYAKSDVYDVKPIKTHLFGAIVVTMLCCVPTGIFALYHAGKVAVLIASGCNQEAKAHSKSAFGWIVASLILWCILMLGFIFFLILLFLCVLTINKGIQ